MPSRRTFTLVASAIIVAAVIISATLFAPSVFNTTVTKSATGTGSTTIATTMTQTTTSTTTATQLSTVSTSQSSTTTSTQGSVTTSTTTVAVRNVLVNGGFEHGLGGWEVVAGSGLLDNLTHLPPTVFATQKDPHSGEYAIEFATRSRQGPSNSTYCRVPGDATSCNYTSLLQHVPHLDGHGECVLDSTRFGVSVRPELFLSLWYRTPNSTSDNFGIGVTFHNRSSKIAIGYSLAWEGHPPSSTKEAVNVLVNNSTGPDWRQARFDLYHDFLKYFGIDPVANHYCVNYIALTQYNANNDPPGNYVYCYIDDIELDEVTQ